MKQVLIDSYGTPWEVARCAEVLDVGGIDRKGQHVEHDLVRTGLADVRHLGAARDLPGRSVPVDQHLLHAVPPREFPGHFVGPSTAYKVIRQGVKRRMAAKAFDEMNSGAPGSGTGDSVRAPYRGVERDLDRDLTAVRRELTRNSPRDGLRPSRSLAKAARDKYLRPLFQCPKGGIASWLSSPTV